MQQSDVQEQPLVSVVVPTFNSESTIENCLRSIISQTYRNIEITVVDKGSKDNTINIARRYTSRVFVTNAKERSEQKNYGIIKSDGEYICFIDSDMELTPRVIEECVNLIESDERVGGIIIPERSVGDGFWVKVRDFERSFYAGTEVESARFFRRDLVLEAGGFDDDIIFFEESTLPQKIEKLGYNVKARVKSEIIHNEREFSLLKWLKKKHYYGKTACKYIERYRDHVGKQINPLNRLNLFLKNKKFYSKPQLALGVIILKSLEYISIISGYMIKKAQIYNFGE